jgi:hypothetical protein
MTTITIGGNERELAQACASWIRDEVRALRSRGMPVCIQISIHSGPFNLLLSTPACPSSDPATREPNTEERRILDLWHTRGMSNDDFDVDQLIAFVNEIKRG